MTKDTNGNERELHELIVAACPEILSRTIEVLSPDEKTIIDASDGTIRLADILRAILKQNPANRTRYIIESGGDIVQRTFYENGGQDARIVSFYNLTKDTLSEQSPGFKSWLLGILKPNLDISGL